MRHVLVATTAALAVVAVSIPGTGNAQGRPWSEGYVPNLPVVTQDGKTVRFYDDLIKGKIVIISFIYTSCRDICPLTTARLAQVEEKLGDVVGRDIFLISMTVDPENDTPDKLKQYAEAFSAGPGWTFVTGKPEDVRAINYKFGDRSGKLSEHRNEIVLGNDVTGEWQRDSVFGDLNRLVITIRSMDPDWRDHARAIPNAEASNNLLLTGQPGQALFKKMCAPCHTVGAGDRVGPDLRGITARRDRAWLAGFIRDPEKQRRQKDPIALALAGQYPGVRMPGLGLAENDAADLIDYLQAETSRLSALQDPSPPHHHHHHHHH
jgi:protein SCO1